MDENEIELTELTDLEVVRQDAVRNPASGFPFLVMKAVVKDVNAVGGIDEKPDIAGAESVIQQLARLIESEARELAVCPDEAQDLHTLMEALCLMQCFRENEVWEDEDDGAMLKSADGLVFKAHRKFSSDERKDLASKGHALPDGSYPIPDADALRRAAILAKSGHGDVAAAKRLIAKRAKELKVPNPLADSAQKDAPEGVEPQTPEAVEPQADDGAVTKEAVAEMIAAAVAEVSKSAEDRIKAAEDELAVLKATPIPAGIALTAPADATATREQANAVAKAAYHRRQLGIHGLDRDLEQFHKTELARAEALITG